LGDWFDSFVRSSLDQILSFNMALERASKNDTGDIFILGNHDNHYLNDCARGAGYQINMRYQFEQLLNSHINKFKIIHKEGNIVFSHGGITKWFIDEFELYTNEKVFDLDIINEVFNNKLSWNKNNPIFWISDFRYGFNKCSGPLWCDWKELTNLRNTNDIKLLDIIQVVGHTATATKYNDENIKNIDDKFYCIDCLDYKNQILKINDNKISIVEF
jgi:hypothetical protein